MKLSSSISRVCQIVCTFSRREKLQSLADCEANGLDGSGGGFSEQVFDLGEDLFDRI
jgi:hypothetical protein